MPKKCNIEVRDYINSNLIEVEAITNAITYTQVEIEARSEESSHSNEESSHSSTFNIGSLSETSNAKSQRWSWKKVAKVAKRLKQNMQGKIQVKKMELGDNQPS